MEDHSLDDNEIIELYWARNEKAIQETDRKYGRYLFLIANNILHNRLDSEECKNDTYFAIWNRIPPNRPDVFAAFITKIIQNTAIDKYKEKNRQKRVPSQMTVCIDELENVLPSNGGLSDEACYADELGRLINAYLGSLTKRQQYIFISLFYIGEKLEKIAYELNVNTSTVFREAEKIKKDLKTYLERNDIYV